MLLILNATANCAITYTNTLILSISVQYSNKVTVSLVCTYQRSATHVLELILEYSLNSLEENIFGDRGATSLDDAQRVNQKVQ